jgi:hypothetical protein
MWPLSDSTRDGNLADRLQIRHPLMFGPVLAEGNVARPHATPHRFAFLGVAFFLP